MGNAADFGARGSRFRPRPRCKNSLDWRIDCVFFDCFLVAESVEFTFTDLKPHFSAKSKIEIQYL